MKILFLSLFIPLMAFGAGKIIDADIAPSGIANIARNKLAASTAHNAATFDASGYLAAGVSPGANGNVLQSNGTDWISAANTAALSVGNFSASPSAKGMTLSANVLNLDPADATHPGGLLAADWVTFNSKQAAGNYITALTSDVTASGPGSVAATVAKIQGTTVSGTTGTTNVVFSSAPTLTNPVVGTQANSDNSTKAASTAYVTAALAQLTPSVGVYAASVANVAGTYVNAVSGVCIGDTFTTTATTAFALDGTSPPLNSIVLLKDQTNSYQDGRWQLTTQAVGGVTGAILTRAFDDDSAADFNAIPIVAVQNGTQAGYSFYRTNSAITTCNSDAQTWSTFQKSSSSYASSTLTNTHLFVGNSSNVATDVAASGDLTLANTGAFTIANSAVTNAKIANSTIDLTAKVTGALPVLNGGTGQTSYTDGQLLIGNTSGNTLTKATLTQGSGITITNGNGSITIAASGAGGTSSTEWASYTPTINGFGAATAIGFKFRRVGDSAEVIGIFTAGIVNSTLASFTLPTLTCGSTIDSAKVAVNNDTSNVGPNVGTWGDNVSANSAGYMITATATSTTLVYCGGFYSSTSMLAAIAGNTSFTSSTKVSVHFTVPISGCTNSN